MPSTETPTLSNIHVYPIKSCHSIQLDEVQVGSLGLDYDRRFVIIEDKNSRFITQRKYSSLNLLRPIIDKENDTITLTSSQNNQEPLTLPLHPDTSGLPERTIQLWKDRLQAFDMGDEAGEWLHQFLKLNRQHDLANNHNEDDPVNEDEVPLLRLVTLEDPSKGRYQRQSNPDLPNVHSPFTDFSPVSFGFESSLKKLNDDLVDLGISNGARIPLNRFRNNLTISGTLPYDEDGWLVVKIGEVTFYVIMPLARCTVPGVDQETGNKDEWGGPLSYLKKVRSFPEEPNDGFFCCHVAPLTSGTIRIGDKIEILERVPADKLEKPLVK
ncbi:unnamed protein product [Cunninghamella blakesleeana]